MLRWVLRYHFSIEMKSLFLTRKIILSIFESIQSNRDFNTRDESVKNAITPQSNVASLGGDTNWWEFSVKTPFFFEKCNIIIEYAMGLQIHSHHKQYQTESYMRDYKVI